MGVGSGVNRDKEFRYVNAVRYAEIIYECLKNTDVNDSSGLSKRHNLLDSLDDMKNTFKKCHDRGNKIIFIGNGGSSAIASHMAIDYSKNGGMRAISLNDFPTLTCLANDFGYQYVFSKQIEYHAHKDDCIVCISTGGKSPNIINAAYAARSLGCRDIFTFTGMKSDNTLRTQGRLNFYVGSFDYGIVEIAHLTLLHSVCNRTFRDDLLQEIGVSQE